MFIAILLAVVSVGMLLMTTSAGKIAGNCCILGISVVLAFVFRGKVKVEASYTEK